LHTSGAGKREEARTVSTYAACRSCSLMAPGVAASGGAGCARASARRRMSSPQNEALPRMSLKPLSGASLWLAVIITAPSVPRWWAAK